MKNERADPIATPKVEKLRDDAKWTGDGFQAEKARGKKPEGPPAKLFRESEPPIKDPGLPPVYLYGKNFKNPTCWSLIVPVLAALAVAAIALLI